MNEVELIINDIRNQAKKDVLFEVIEELEHSVRVHRENEQFCSGLKYAIQSVYTTIGKL